MRLNLLLMSELALEAQATERVLERLPAEHWNWRPHARSRTAGEIARHIAGLPALFLGHLGAEELDHDRVTLPGDSLEAVRSSFRANVARATDVLAGLTDEQLLSPWRYRYGQRVVFELPRIVVAKSMGLAHLVHHRGQLTVYLRLLEVPVPPLYGPTADEAQPEASRE